MTDLVKKELQRTLRLKSNIKWHVSEYLSLIDKAEGVNIKIFRRDNPSLYFEIELSVDMLKEEDLGKIIDQSIIPLVDIISSH